jgi:hypothetical protein
MDNRGDPGHQTYEEEPDPPGPWANVEYSRRQPLQATGLASPTETPERTNEDPLS